MRPAIAFSLCSRKRAVGERLALAARATQGGCSRKWPGGDNFSIDLYGAEKTGGKT